jgi:hypothetical protein
MSDGHLTEGFENLASLCTVDDVLLFAVYEDGLRSFLAESLDRRQTVQHHVAGDHLHVEFNRKRYQQLHGLGMVSPDRLSALRLWCVDDLYLLQKKMALHPGCLSLQRCFLNFQLCLHLCRINQNIYRYLSLHQFLDLHAQSIHQTIWKMRALSDGLHTRCAFHGV